MEKSNVYKTTELKCAHCGKNLFDNVEMSMIQIIQDNESNNIISVKPCCKGECDKILEKRFLAKEGETCGWKDLSEFLNPYLYLKNVMAVLNVMNEGAKFDNSEAFEEYKNVLLNCYPYISRNLSEEEIKETYFAEMCPF